MKALIGEATLGGVDGIDDDVVGEDEGSQVIEAVHVCEEVVQLVGQGKLDGDSVETGKVLSIRGEGHVSADGEFHGGQLYQLSCGLSRLCSEYVSIN